MSSRRRRHSQTSVATKLRPSPYPLAKHRSHSNTLVPGERPTVLAADDDEVASSVFERTPEPDAPKELEGDDGDDDANTPSTGQLNPHVEPFVPRTAGALLHRNVDRVRNPAMLPVQASIPRTPAQKESTRRLIVVLERACLEAYKVSGSGGGAGKKEAKYALLNCDDHQGVLAKMNRDIADARPDITHQVPSARFSSGHRACG